MTQLCFCECSLLTASKNELLNLFSFNFWLTMDPILHLGIYRWISPRLQYLFAGHAYTLQWSPGTIPARQLVPSSTKTSNEGERSDPAERLQLQPLLVEVLLNCLLLPPSGLWTHGKPRQSFSTAPALRRTLSCQDLAWFLVDVTNKSSWAGFASARALQPLETPAPRCPQTTRQRKAGCLQADFLERWYL